MYGQQYNNDNGEKDKTTEKQQVVVDAKFRIIQFTKTENYSVCLENYSLILATFSVNQTGRSVGHVLRARSV
jgi:hypothetical protein